MFREDTKHGGGQLGTHSSFNKKHIFVMVYGSEGAKENKLALLKLINYESITRYKR